MIRKHPSFFCRNDSSIGDFSRQLQETLFDHLLVVHLCKRGGDPIQHNLYRKLPNVAHEWSRRNNLYRQYPHHLILGLQNFYPRRDKPFTCEPFTYFTRCPFM